MKTSNSIRAWIFAVMTAGATSVALADRGLIVGIGDYQIGTPRDKDGCPSLCDLPGIDLDVERMKAQFRSFGVPADSTRIRQNAEAGSRAIAEDLQWLGEAGPQERVFVYFSGHGGQVPDDGADEADGMDDVLLLYDASDDLSSGVLSDDRFGAWLAGVRAPTYIFVDACNSGTITKGINANPHVVVKRYIPARRTTSKAAATSRSSGTFFDWKGSAEDRNIVFTAVREDQNAPASANGSAFTIALDQVLLAQQSPQTPLALRDLVEASLRDGLGVDTSHVTPQVVGSQSALHQPLTLRVQNPKPTLWSQLEQMASVSLPGVVTLEPNKAVFSVANRDLLQLSVSLNKGGYLTLLSVDRASDSAVVLLPNTWAPSVKLAPGRYTLPDDFPLAPGSERKLSFPATSPGETLVVAIVTPGPLTDWGSIVADKAAVRFKKIDKAMIESLSARIAGPRRRQFSVALAEDAQPTSAVTPQAAAVIVDIGP